MKPVTAITERIPSEELARLAEAADGMVVVPRVLTTDMIAAVRNNGGMQAAAFAIAAWKDLLNAAPTNPSVVASLVEEVRELREAAREVVRQNNDYLLHLNNGAQTDPLTHAINAIAALLPGAPS